LKIPSKVPPLEIPLDPGVPLQRQVHERLREMILHLPRGARLPSSRVLARRLGVSRNTVVFAYEELAADGLLRGRTGSGTCVERGSRVVRLRDPDGLTFDCIGA